MDLNYQTITGTLNETSPVERRIPFDFFDDYEIATGIYLYMEQNAGVPAGYFGIETDNDKMMNYLPFEFLFSNLNYLEKHRVFRKIFVPAKGKKCYLNFKGNSFTDCVYRVMFRLENNVPKPLKKENYQTVSKILTQYGNEYLDIELDRDYSRCTGFALYSKSAGTFFSSFIVSIFTNDRSVILNPVDLALFNSYTYLPHENRFLPIDMKAAGRKIIVKIEPDGSVYSGDNITVDLIFRLEK